MVLEYEAAIAFYDAVFGWPEYRSFSLNIEYRSFYYKTRLHVW